MRFILIVFICLSCKNSSDNSELVAPIDSDVALWNLVQSTTEWTYWKNSPDTLAKGGGSGHLENRLITKYNTKAKLFLDDAGKVKNNIEFEEGSLIVKELFFNTELSTIAVMYKNKKSRYAFENDWVWGYYRPDGTVRSSITTANINCQNCHASGIDYTLMNSAHN